MANQTFYLNRYITQKKYKILRVTELVCCLVSFALAVKIFTIRLYIIPKALLMVVTTAFLFITLVDSITWFQLRPMGHRTWIVFAVTAFEMYNLCGGFLLFLRRDTHKILLQVTCALNFLTGFVFILDGILIFLQYSKWVFKRETRVEPIKEYVDRAVSAMTILDCEFLFKRQSPRSHCTIRTRPYVIPPCSYGGTFAVSKDIPPLPTPDPLRQEYSPRRRMYSTLVNPYPDIGGSGDFPSKIRNQREHNNEIVLTARDLTYFQKSSVYTQYRAEIPESKTWSSLMTELVPSPFKIKTQADQVLFGKKKKTKEQKKKENTNEAEEPVGTVLKTKSDDMIVGPCNTQGSLVSPPMQDTIWHQYCQQPCVKCGRTHYQQQTTINGSLCSSPLYNNYSCSRAPQAIMQSPCVNSSCPSMQAAMMNSCGNPSCPVTQERRYCCNMTPGRRNGLQSEYLPSRRYPPQSQNICSSCNRCCRPPDCRGESCCIRECRFADKSILTDHCCTKSFGSQCNCCCSCKCSPTTAKETTEPTTAREATETKNICSEQCKLTHCGTMAVMETMDKEVQLERQTQEFNPQTSETRIVGASLLSRIIRSYSKSDGRCTSKKPCHDKPVCKGCSEEGAIRSSESETTIPNGTSRSMTTELNNKLSTEPGQCPLKMKPPCACPRPNIISPKPQITLRRPSDEKEETISKTSSDEPIQQVISRRRSPGRSIREEPEEIITYPKKKTSSRSKQVNEPDTRSIQKKPLSSGVQSQITTDKVHVEPRYSSKIVHNSQRSYHDVGSEYSDDPIITSFDDAASAQELEAQIVQEEPPHVQIQSSYQYTPKLESRSATYPSQSRTGDHQQKSYVSRENGSKPLMQRSRITENEYERGTSRQPSYVSEYEPEHLDKRISQRDKSYVTPHISKRQSEHALHSELGSRSPTQEDVQRLSKKSSMRPKYDSQMSRLSEREVAEHDYQEPPSSRHVYLEPVPKVSTVRHSPPERDIQKVNEEWCKKCCTEEKSKSKKGSWKNVFLKKKRQ